MLFDNMKFSCGVKVGKYIYASAELFNGLFKIDTCSGEAEFLGMFPNEDIAMEGGHFNAIYINDKVFFFPNGAKNISVYSIKNNTFESVVFEHKYGYVGSLCEELLLMIPSGNAEDIYSLNYKNNCVEKYILYEEIRSFVTNDGNRYSVLGKNAFVDRKIFIPVQRTNQLLIIDLEKKGIERRTIADIDIRGVFSGCGYVWITSSNKVYKYDYDNNSINTSELIMAEGDLHNNAVSWVVDITSGVYFFPGQCNSIFMNTEGKYKVIYSEDTKSERNKVFNPIVEDESVWILPHGYKYMLNIHGDECRTLSIAATNICDDIRKQIIEAYKDKKRKSVIIESDELSLTEFISIIN